MSASASQSLHNRATPGDGSSASEHGKAMENKSGKSRSHSFTGCWTCRRRRVKCSLEKPTCMRCTTAGLECQGYGFLFDIPDGVQSSRQRLTSDSRPDLKLKLSNREIDEYLIGLESARETTTKGPFSVISFLEPGQFTMSKDAQKNHIKDSENETSDHPPKQKTPSIRRPSSTGSSKSTTSSRGAQTDAEFLATLEQLTMVVPESLHAFQGLSTDEKRLFEHYMCYITPALAPFAGPVCGKHRNIVASVALYGRMSSEHKTGDTAAVFHGVCAVASMSLARSNAGPNTYCAQALRHANMALACLRSSIENGQNSYLTIAIAVMTILLFEHVADRGQSYKAHLEAGLRCLLLALGQSSQVDESTRAICEQWALACVLGNHASIQQQLALRAGMGQGTGFLERECGMPSTIMDFLISINNIAGNKPAPIPSSEVDEPESRLRSLQLRPNKNESAALVTKAVSLYFSREIRGVNLSESEYDVDIGLSALEALGTVDPNNCMIAWSASIIGPECHTPSQKARFTAWCTARRSNGAGNITSVRCLTKAVWYVRANVPGYENVSWYVLRSFRLCIGPSRIALENSIGFP